MGFTKQQLEKAKAVKSAEELLALAKENGLELTEEEAKKYFAELHKEGELADEELDNVTGGLCSGGHTYSDDKPHYLVVSPLYGCPNHPKVKYGNGESNYCWCCKYSVYKSGILYCTARTLDNDPYR